MCIAGVAVRLQRSRALQLVGSRRLTSAYSEINISGRHTGYTCILSSLLQATRTEFKAARTSSASQRWDNRWSWYCE